VSCFKEVERKDAAAMELRLLLLAGAMSWIVAAHASGPGAEASRLQGIVEYEIGHYAVAVGHFRRAAELGDLRSAEILALMYRLGQRLYGDQFSVDAREAARWTELAVERRFAPEIKAAADARSR
jgi:TPR repeat protein